MALTGTRRVRARSGIAARVGATLLASLSCAGPLMAATGVALVLSASPASAELRICNKTASRVGIAIGYKGGETWTTEGWWNLAANACETLLPGPLAARYYYIYSVDYDRGGEWSGRSFMCTQERTFTIKGTEDCLKRGFERTGFFEIDTGEQRSWTVQLTEPGRAGVGAGTTGAAATGN